MALCSPAFAAYHIEAKGAEAKGTNAVFTLEGSGSFTCATAVAKQPNSTGKELITEEQDLITTFSECKGKLGTAAVEVTIKPEVDFKISAGEKNGSETKWKGIKLSIAKEMVVKAVSGTMECTMTMPAEVNQSLKEIKWEDTKITKGEYQSQFQVGVAGKGTSSGGKGCEAMQVLNLLAWQWGGGPMGQGGEVIIG